jgi:hypothetical protein
MRGALCPLKPQGPSSPGGPTFGVNLRGAGVSLPGLGCPQASYSPSLAACGSEQKEKKRFFGDTPITCPPDRVPAKGRPPLGTPP